MPPLKVLECADRQVVFDPADLSLRLLPPDETQAAIRDGTHLDLLSLIAESTRDLAVPCESDASDERDAHTMGGKADARRPLDRLTITVSNTCNMGCSYCYANGGTYYNKPGTMMSRETAMNALNRAARSFSSINHINFFGGEPTMNRDLIEMVCEYAVYLHAQGVLTTLPTFGVTTNAYVLDDRTLEILVGYNFSVTVSIDGPKEVHDLRRPTKRGTGTYDAVVKNIRKLIAHGITPEFECTFTVDHLRLGIDIRALMDFFYDEFGSHTIHCPIVSAAPDSPDFIPWDICLDLQRDAIRYSVQNLYRGIPKTYSTASRMLNALVSKNPIHNYCPAGRSAVTVNADGNIYACFMLMQDKSSSFGSVNQPGAPARLDHNANKIEGMVQESDKSKNPACQKCWARPLCHGCLGEDLERQGPHVIRSEVPGISAFCDYKRGIAEAFLKSAGEACIAAASR